MKYAIIPKPVRYDLKEDTVELSSQTEIRCVKEFVKVGNMLSTLLKTDDDAQENLILISKAKSIAPEGYAMYTEFGNICIKASTEIGAYHAYITLKWILMQAKKTNGKKIVNGFLIEDKPCYVHRGMMLDECRHFFGIDFVKELLDNMAMLKMNTFHWHLSDDQGFRIECKTFPLLNEIGSSRRYAGLKGLGQKNYGDNYGPYYYTHEQIKEIVSYAKNRHIVVIPEFDMPGHCTAILASYPELSCNNENVEVALTNGILKQILCASNEKVFEFIDIFYDEICPLFDGENFHIGGDEADYYHWKKCSNCQQKIKDNNLKNEKALQVMFMNDINKVLKKHGKKCIVWNDCLSDELDSSIACQYWIFNRSQGKKQAFNRDIILSPMLNFYLDFSYKAISVKKVYSFNEKAVGFNKSGMKIRGIEAELWTEWIDGIDVAQFSIYPRIAAVSEVGWDSLSNRNFKDFDKRLNFYKIYLDSKKINYCRLKKSISPTLSMYGFGANGKEFKKNEKLKMGNKSALCQ